LQKDDLVFVGHMLDTTRQAIRLFRGRTREHFDQDETLSLALTHLVQVIGEAARRVSPPFREQHSNVPWSAIIAMRHRVVHDYLHVDLDVVWDVVSRDLPELAEELEKILPE
jgi:uncharacterized protein with HEPN domain